MTTTDSRTLNVAIPAEGVWFDRLDNPDGTAGRTYWKDGRVAIQIALGPHAEDPNSWGVVVAWGFPMEGGNDRVHVQNFGPFAKPETARAIMDAVGIGLNVAMPAEHISKIPGAVIETAVD